MISFILIFLFSAESTIGAVFEILFFEKNKINQKIKECIF